MLALLIASQSSLATANDDPMSVRKKSKSKVESTTNEKQKELEEIIKNGNGMVIAPNPNAKTEEVEEVQEEPEYIINVVKQGESLSLIAGQYLGDIHRWKELVELNKDAYPSLDKNPNLIHPNWKIKVPVEKKNDEIATDSTNLNDKKDVDDSKVDNKSNVEVTDASTDSEDVKKSLIPNWTTRAKVARLQQCVDRASRANPNKLIRKLDSETIKYMVEKGYMDRDEWMAMNPPFGYTYSIDPYTGKVYLVNRYNIALT